MRAIGRQLFIVALGTVLGASGRDAVADEAACQTVLDAIVKQAAVPVHQKISIESAAAPGKPLQSETDPHRRHFIHADPRPMDQPAL